MKLDELPEEKYVFLVHAVRVAFVVLALIVLSLLSGCGKREVYVPSPPVEAKCAAICYEPCVGDKGDTGIRWDGTPTSPAAFDDMDDRVIPGLAEKLRQCDTRRKACVKCMDALEAEKVIIQPVH